MGDREDKLSKAREKLEKFRKKKNKLQEPATAPEDVQSNASSASSPLIFQTVNNPESKPSTPPLSQTPIAASPPAASLSSYFGVPANDVISTGFETIVPTSDVDTPVSKAVGQSFTGSTLQETGEFHRESSIQDVPSAAEVPNFLEETSVLDQPNQSLHEDNRVEEPAVTSYFSSSITAPCFSSPFSSPAFEQPTSSSDTYFNSTLEQTSPCPNPTVEPATPNSYFASSNQMPTDPQIDLHSQTPTTVLEQPSTTLYVSSEEPLTTVKLEPAIPDLLEQTPSPCPNPVMEPATPISYFASSKEVYDPDGDTYLSTPVLDPPFTKSYVSTEEPDAPPNLSPAIPAFDPSVDLTSNQSQLPKTHSDSIFDSTPALEHPSTTAHVFPEDPDAPFNLTPVIPVMDPSSSTSFLPNTLFEGVASEKQDHYNLMNNITESQPEMEANMLLQVIDQIETVVPESNRESVNQLSSQMSELLADQSSSAEHDIGTQINYSTKVLELENRNQELVALLEEARLENLSSVDELVLVKKQMNEVQSMVGEETTAANNRLSEENSKQKADLAAQTQAIELLVSQKTEVEASNINLKEESESLLEQKTSLESTVEHLGSACAELRAQALSEGSNSEMLEAFKLQTEKEIKGLKESLLEKEESYRELQSKLGKVTTENSSSQTQLAQVTSELEMCKVHLIQLRGSGAQNLLNEKDSEIGVLNNELGLTRKNLGEAMGRVEHLAGEREQLAEQYRSYSRDLASQAERLSEQLRKFQDENARLLHREAGLVQNVASLETQVQSFRKEGKNVTEEEICRLKDQILTYETEVRMTRDEKNKMQQMLVERGNQVDEMGQRLAMRDAKIMELQARASGLETTVEMMKSTSHSSDNDQAQLLAACQSDKVAASMAMQQNVSLKARLEELQGAVVALTNNKAELLDQLDAANRTVDSCSNIQAEITARDEAVKEKEIMLTNIRNQVKYLEEELRRRRTPDREEYSNVAAINIEENEDFISIEKELYQAKEMIRNLNSQNSELRSKLEVLSSNTRDCSESRCNSSSDGRVDMADSSLSESSDSFVEIERGVKSSVTSTDSFVNVDPVQKDFKVEDYDGSETDVTSVEQTVIRTVDLPFIPSQELINSQTNSSVDNFESMKQLENRFMAAMEQLAELSSDKEQLEHLVERLQEETETIGDYVIMYQHQRKMQKMKIQEKEEQVVQLARDRAELLTKLTQLQELVTKMVDDPSDEVAIATHETLAEVVDTKATATEKVSDKMASSMEKEKILELINEIGTGSNQIMARCENFEPWFWENSPSKVMTV